MSLCSITNLRSIIKGKIFNNTLILRSIELFLNGSYDESTMAKFTDRQKLKEEEEENLIIDFCHVVADLQTSEEAVLFVRDLLSKQEVRMLAKRLKIARMLMRGEKYSDIAAELKVSSGTIARVNLWLHQSGEGFRLALLRTKENSEPSKPSWSGMKRKYPMYYWPEILLKEIICSANKNHREKLKNIIAGMDKKTELVKDLDVILAKKYNTSKY